MSGQQQVKAILIVHNPPPLPALAWHPVHEGLFVSGGGDGSLGYWLVNTEKEVEMLEHAHDLPIWSVEWHPLGHILATGECIFYPPHT